MRALLVAIVALVLAGAAGLGAHAWYEQQPPALDQSGPGTVLRLTGESGGVPPPRTSVRLQNGSSASLSMAGTGTARGRPAGLVWVVPPGTQGRRLTLAEGQSAAAGGLEVTVLHVWRMPDGANDAIDVRVLPSP